MTKYLFPIVSALLLSACVTTRYCPIETLHPAQLTITAPKEHIAVCASQTLLHDALLANETAAGVHADSLIANVLFSLQNEWNKAPGYDNSRFDVHILKDGEALDSSRFDLIVRLDDLQINNTYYGQEYSYIDWEAYLHVQYAAQWSMRTASGGLLDRYTDRDLIVWSSGIRSGKEAAVMNLPEVKDAWWDMGIALAQHYVARVAPQWDRGTRPVYMINKFPDLSQQAYTAMQNDSYERAFDVWETMLLSCRKRGQRGVKSQITHNMAVASEFQNRLDEAVYWAGRSKSFRKRTATVYYSLFLRERQQEQILLDQQTASSVSQ